MVGWTEKIEKESGGRLKFEIYPNGQLVGPPNRQFDAARNGITDIAFCLHGVTPGRYPMTELANLPFTWPSSGAELAGDGEADDRAGAEISRRRAHRPAYPVHVDGQPGRASIPRMPIKTLDDFKGKKIRYASITNKYLLDALGAVPMLIPPPEAQDAIAKGIVDGAGFPHEAGLAYDLASVAKYAIEPPLASATFALVMNPAKYNSLPADLRAILDKESGVAGADELRQGLAGAGEVRARPGNYQEGPRDHHAVRRRRRQDEGSWRSRSSTRRIDALGKSRQAGARILRGLYQVMAP